MKHLLLALFVLSVTSGVWAETLPVTLWQNETRFQLKQGDTIHLDRGSFHLVMPIKVGEHIGLAAGSSETKPSELEAFKPGRGMAGPYDGVFLTWEAFHYFHIDKSTGIPRMDLWDRKTNLYQWKALRFYDNTGSGAEVLGWSEVPDFTMIFRKDGFEELVVNVKWEN